MNFTASIASDVRFGDLTFTSTLSITIKNNTDRGDLKPSFSITIPHQFVAQGKAAQAIQFVLIHTRGNDLVKTYSNANPEKDRIQPKDGTRWSFGLPIKFPAGDTIKLQLSRITASKEGNQTLSIAVDDPISVVPNSLEVIVRNANASPRITNFKAEKYYNLPGVPIELSWETDKDSVVELRRFDTPLVLSRDKAQGYTDKTKNLSGLQLYQLVATADGQSVSQWLLVEVQPEGWYRIDECPWGAPTLLLNDHENKLYGIFLNLKTRRSAVYELKPEQGVMGQGDRKLEAGDVPEGMETSPGAFFKNKIWLVGGSQIDPDVCSNKVWCFDPPGMETQKPGVPLTADWTSRMGHACIVFDRKLWILGGVDENGNTLSDVLSSPDGISWKKEAPLTAPLCLLTAAAFNDKLWVYGGVDAPFGTPPLAKAGLFYRTAGSENWKTMSFRESPSLAAFGTGMLFASAVYVRNSQLCGLATARPASGDPSAMFTLSGVNYDEGSIDVNPTSIPKYTNDDTWPWLTKHRTSLQQAFRLSAVSFKSFVFVISLVYGVDNERLTYLLQST